MFLRNMKCFSPDDVTTPSSEAVAESPASPETEAPQATDELTALRAELDASKAKATEAHDRMLRLAAEFDNARKRWERERGEVRQYSITEFARDLLPVIDAFDRATAAVESAELKGDTEEGRKMLAIVEGVQLVSKVFHDSVKKHGIERVPGKGELFNPTYHNAVARVVDESLEQDTVVDEFVTGYRIGDRVLRTAMVRVGTKE